MKLDKVGDKNTKDMKKTAKISKGKVQWDDVATDLDLAITAYNTQVSFDWIVKSENAPHNVEFDIQDGGIPVIYGGFDAVGKAVNVTTDKKDNKIAESIEKGGKYPKIINPQLRVGNSSDHGSVSDYNPGGIYTDYWPGTNPRVGMCYWDYFSHWYHLHSWYRWANFSIPSGSDIKSSSWITLRAYSSLLWSGGINTRLYFDDQSSPSAPSSASNYLSRTVTTNYTAWNIPVDSWTFSTDFTSNTIESIIQELVNSYGGITTAQCLHKDVTFESGTANRWESSYGYSSSPNNAALLHIEYTPASNIQEGADNNNQWTAGIESVNDVQGVRAYLDSYDPEPVFEWSCFWVMLQEGTDRWAQCGWAKRDVDSFAYIWVQYTNDSGFPIDKWYNVATDNWYDTPQSVPMGSHLYTVTYDSVNQSFSAKYDNGSPLTIAVNWVPDALSVSSEVINFTFPDLGDHAPGDTNTKLEAQKIEKKVSGSWSDASLYIEADGAWYGRHDTNVTNSPGFRVWDSRCDN